MNRYLLILFMSSAFANANEVKWAPVNMELGCVPFSELDNNYPFLSGKRTPTEILNVLKVRDADAKLIPFIEFNVAAISEKERHQRENSPVFKLLNKSNAIVISWGKNENEDGLLFYTEDLCKAIYGKVVTD